MPQQRAATRRRLAPPLTSHIILAQFVYTHCTHVHVSFVSYFPRRHKGTMPTKNVLRVHITSSHMPPVAPFRLRGPLLCCTLPACTCMRSPALVDEICTAPSLHTPGCTPHTTGCVRMHRGAQRTLIDLVALSQMGPAGAGARTGPGDCPVFTCALGTGASCLSTWRQQRQWRGRAPGGAREPCSKQRRSGPRIRWWHWRWRQQQRRQQQRRRVTDAGVPGEHGGGGGWGGHRGGTRSGTAAPTSSAAGRCWWKGQAGPAGAGADADGGTHERTRGGAAAAAAG